jgi:tetratricopeptide (TPR) repeat protein
MYNKAVVFSPNIDDNLARACADRASCLLRLGDFARALADIEQAQQADEYQFERRFELDERKGLAYLGLGRYAEATTAFTTAISLLEDGAGFLPRKFVERKMAELQENLRACYSAGGGGIRPTAPDVTKNDDVNTGKFQSMKKLPDLRGRNREYPALTDKVDVILNMSSFRGSGPAILANTDIAAGEIIGLEKPIASYLEKEFVKTNCWNCLVTLKERDGFRVKTQETKYVESWPNTTSAWAGLIGFDIPVDRYNGVRSLLHCTGVSYLPQG